MLAAHWLVVSTYIALDASVAAAAPMFTNVTAAAGINHVHTLQWHAGDDRAALRRATLTAMDWWICFSQSHGCRRTCCIATRATASKTCPPRPDSSTGCRPMASRPLTSTTTAISILYVMGSQSSRHYLYINDGAGHFTEDADRSRRRCHFRRRRTESPRHGRGLRRLRR